MNTSPIRVLVIDDDEDAYILIRHMVSKIPGSEYSTRWASTYEDGLEAMRNRKYDVYLLDYRLGHRNGLELLREGMKAGCREPIIMLTAASNPDVDKEATSIGAADFLVKSDFDAILLERTIRYSLAQYRTLRALKESEERLAFQANILSQVNDAIISIDNEGNITYWNHAAQALYGYTSAEAIGKPFKEITKVHWVKPVEEHLASYYLSEKGAFRGLNHHFKKGGEEMLVEVGLSTLKDLDGEKRGQLVVVRDITKRKRMEDALQESNERFRLLFERSKDAILIMDDNGRYLQANSAASELLGYSKEELLKMNVTDIFKTDGRRKVAEKRKEQLGSVQATGEFVYLRPDKERRIVEFSAYRFAPNLHLNIFRDITERRQLENEVQGISEREQRRIGQDLHDGLCQHLLGIMCLSKVLEQKLEDTNEQDAADARQIVQLVNQAISQTRDLARGLSPMDLENNDIAAALTELATNAEKLFNVSCVFEESDPGNPLILKDKASAIHVYRIAQEAINNAVKHGQAKKIQMSLSSAEEPAVLMIQDDGIGLSKSFSRHKGMGMKVMNYRARMIGATLEIKPAPEKGTVVICKFPKNPASENTDSIYE